MSTIPLLLALLATPAMVPPLEPVEARPRPRFPLFTFYCGPGQGDSLGGKWVPVEIAMNPALNLFGVNRRPTRDGAGAPLIDGPVELYGDVRREDGGTTVFFRPNAKYGVQFEMRIAPPTNPPSTIDSHSLSGVLTRTDGSARRDCMLVPNSEQAGAKQ